MTTTIDSDGSVMIPEEIRRQAGLRPGVPLEVRCVDGRIEIEPVATPVRLARRGRLLVTVAESPGEELTVETVEEIRRELASERDHQP